jgi:hypothetical protein
MKRRKVLKGTWKAKDGRPRQSLMHPYDFVREMECGHRKPIPREQKFAYCKECDAGDE